MVANLAQELNISPEVAVRNKSFILSHIKTTRLKSSLLKEDVGEFTLRFKDCVVQVSLDGKGKLKVIEELEPSTQK